MLSLSTSKMFLVSVSFVVFLCLSSSSVEAMEDGSSSSSFLPVTDESSGGQQQDFDDMEEQQQQQHHQQQVSSSADTSDLAMSVDLVNAKVGEYLDLRHLPGSSREWSAVIPVVALQNAGREMINRINNGPGGNSDSNRRAFGFAQIVTDLLNGCATEVFKQLVVPILRSRVVRPAFVRSEDGARKAYRFQSMALDLAHFRKEPFNIPMEMIWEEVFSEEITIAGALENPARNNFDDGMLAEGLYRAFLQNEDPSAPDAWTSDQFRDNVTVILENAVSVNFCERAIYDILNTDGPENAPPRYGGRALPTSTLGYNAFPALVSVLRSKLGYNECFVGAQNAFLSGFSIIQKTYLKAVGGFLLHVNPHERVLFQKYLERARQGILS